MERQYGRNSYYDFATFANAGATDALEGSALIQSENIYRASSLIAYGIGLASWSDIEPFTTFEPIQTTERSYDGEPEEALEIKVVLPYDPISLDISDSEFLRQPREYASILQSREYLISYVRADVISGSYMVFTMHVHAGLSFYDKRYHKTRKETLKHDDPQMSKALSDCYTAKKLYGLKDPFKFLGQFIANVHVNKAYVGTFGGKPEFHPVTWAEERWLALVQLSDKQLPGLCPVCGKVIDRRRSAKGGHPKKTCCNAHSDKFSNLKNRIRKESIENANFDSLTCNKELEDAVRRLRRIRKVPDERPLRFGGVELL